MTDPDPLEPSLQLLDVPRGVLEEIYGEARAAFPEECCGWLAGPPDGDSVDTVKACINAQASGNHPTAAQRGAETAYTFNDEDLLALSRSFDTPTPAKIIYHSHPNGGAYLSAVDRDVAISPWGDSPNFPVQQLVIGIDAERVVEAALFAWSGDEAGFVEIARFAGTDTEK